MGFLFWEDKTSLELVVMDVQAFELHALKGQTL